MTLIRPILIAALLAGTAPGAALAQQGAPAPQATAQAPQTGAPTPTPGQQPPGEMIVDVVGGTSAPAQIAIPPMPTAAVQQTAAGSTDMLGRELATIVTNDLKNSGLFNPVAGEALHPIGYAEVTNPGFDYWAGAGVQALVQGFVRANGDGTLTVGCYLYDTYAKTELTRQGFVVPPSDWRRAGHKCADMVYTRLTGEGPYFDSRVVYVAESGPKAHRIKRLAIMDQDGANHRFLTNGQSIILTPRLTPDQRAIVYMSYLNDRPAIYVYDIGTGRQRLLVPDTNLNFAPRVSPDSRWVLFSMAIGGNTDVYRIPIAGGTPQRLTDAPGIDTGGSYSPDGGRIVFESDRSGSQQLYVMNADGTQQQRISFGGGSYATPVWSPRGDLIAYTHMAGNFRIGVMSPVGAGARDLTDDWQDEGPSWSPNGRVLMFFRATQGSSGVADLFSVDLTGAALRRIPTPLDGSDPSWGPLRP
ncbi:Tol-Pal system beta propeller repeat protein TolB [Sphingomonas sp. RT2P30]|uniref:Tol-Pal system beta propeller repeat protein TolB n=1 Tax=Parasphingomonas halimpatiens TaxID=3096162 RepID=UPI002FC6EEC2